MVMSTPEIIVTEMIKPSSKTPPHLSNLNLSFLDQLAPPTYTHLILYYESHDRSINKTSKRLKRSLADALAIYYPLAGRLGHDNSYVDCNDEGAEYFEARFNNIQLSDIVENPCLEELKQYVPIVPRGSCDIPLAVQVSFFGCGGTAIGVCVSHKVADGMSLVMFVNAWAAICRGDVNTIALTRPSFDVASRFPRADLSGFLPSGTPAVTPPSPEKIVTKRFMFSAQKLATLKKAAAGPQVENPTGVEAVSAFIWKHIIESMSSKHDHKTSNQVNVTYAATHAVDIRQRASPHLPQHFFGNACARALATSTASTKDHTYHVLAVKLRDTIRKADGDYVRRLENGDSFLKYYSNNEENDPCFRDGKSIMEKCGFSSWCRFPAYDADFGYWGKPVWVSIIPVPQKYLICLLGTKNGDGIEAWVSMVDEDITTFETNYHLLEQVTTCVDC